MSFTNVYYKRTAGTARSCFVCYRPTTIVLATVNTVDFIYSCPGHLGDRNFATRITDEDEGSSTSARSSVSPEEIARIKQEWEEKQKKKQEKEGKNKEKGKETEDGKKDKKTTEDGSDKSKEGSKSPKPAGALPPSGSSTPSVPTPTHERYSLHRDFYAMRQLEHKKRRQAAQAKELAPRLPGAPTANIVYSAEDKY